MKKQLQIITVVIVVMVLCVSSAAYLFKDELLSSTNKVENKYPVSYFSAEPMNEYAPLTVYFKSLGTDTDGHITLYEWDFGDGYTSIQQNQSHSYTIPGTYVAILTVTDNQGAKNISYKTITVQEKPVEEPPSSITLNDGTIVEGDFQSFEFTNFKHERIIDETYLDNTYCFISGTMKNIEDNSLNTVKVTIRYYNLYYGYLTSTVRNFSHVLPGTPFLFYDGVYGDYQTENNGGFACPMYASLVIEVS